MSQTPPDPHAALDRFVDGELPPEEAEAFRRHLSGCPRCQAALHDRVQLAGLAEDALAGAPEGNVLRPARWRGRAAAAVGVALAAGLAVVVAGRAREVDPSPLFGAAAERPLEMRLSTRGADRYRPYAVVRGAEPAPPPPLPLLAALERRGDWVAIAEGYLATGAPLAARPYLDRAGTSAEAFSARAVLDLMVGHPAEALRDADQSLLRKPSAVARWNRGLALRALGLPLAAARDLDAVAAEGESGWSSEAGRLAAQLRAPRAASAPRPAPPPLPEEVEASAALQQGHPDQALERLGPRLQACASSDRPEDRCLAVERLAGTAALALHRLPEARALGVRALERAGREGDPAGENALLELLGDVAAAANDPGLARAYRDERGLRGVTP